MKALRLFLLLAALTVAPSLFATRVPDVDISVRLGSKSYNLKLIRIGSDNIKCLGSYRTG